jgi:hypothetical protein
MNCSMSRRIGAVETKPRGSQPASTADGLWRWGARNVLIASRQEPGPTGGSARCRRNSFVSMRSWASSARCSASATSSSPSPAA